MVFKIQKLLEDWEYNDFLNELKIKVLNFSSTLN